MQILGLFQTTVKLSTITKKILRIIGQFISFQLGLPFCLVSGAKHARPKSTVRVFTP